MHVDAALLVRNGRFMAISFLGLSSLKFVQNAGTASIAL
jgi:hypothetical protein